jgi:hypothetical protein
MITDVEYGQRNHPVAVKVRLILSVRFAEKVVRSRVTRTVDMVPMERAGEGGVGEEKKIAMRLRFTRVSVPTMKEYQHAESLLA